MLTRVWSQRAYLYWKLDLDKAKMLLAFQFLSKCKACQLCIAGRTENPDPVWGRGTIWEQQSGCYPQCSPGCKARSWERRPDHRWAGSQHRSRNHLCARLCSSSGCDAASPCWHPKRGTLTKLRINALVLGDVRSFLWDSQCPQQWPCFCKILKVKNLWQKEQPVWMQTGFIRSYRRGKKYQKKPI